MAKIKVKLVDANSRFKVGKTSYTGAEAFSLEEDEPRTKAALKGRIVKRVIDVSTTSKQAEPKKEDSKEPKSKGNVKASGVSKIDL